MVEAISQSDLADCAMFLHRWHSERNSTTAVGREQGSLLNLLHWLLIENPCGRGNEDLGYCVRSENGIEGLILCFPARFLLGEKQLTGFGSGSYFVEPRARMLGFFLLKRYLSHPGFDFYFGTTCNGISGALWTQCRASAIPNSHMEYLVPLRYQVVLASFANSRAWPTSAARGARLVGRALDQCLRPGRPYGSLIASPCRDWEKLSLLFYRHRVRESLTTDRSAEYLEWRYGPSSPHGPAETFAFRTGQGAEGWFAITKMARGRSGEIDGTCLLDVVWPREKVTLPELLRAILSCPSVAQSDALFLAPRLGASYRGCRPRAIRRLLPHPQAFLLMAKGRTPIDPARVDLAPADGDSGF